MSTDEQLKQQADDLKLQGTAHYKKREFDEAAKLYQQAWDTYPKDITYLNNLAGQSSSLRRWGTRETREKGSRWGEGVKRARRYRGGLRSSIVC
jgi:hypothetical protein